MKYIVCQVQRNGKPFINVPVVFPEILVHAMVFAQMRSLLEMQYFSNDHKTEVIPLSAGDFSSTSFPDEQFCHGKSESLGVKSREKEDDTLLSMSDYGAGMLFE
jgi:hypothetical protein